MLAAVLILLSAIPAFSVSADLPVEAQLPSSSLSCTSNQTKCLFGCCPYADAVCCDNGLECCQHSETCIPMIGCLGLVNDGEKDIALVYSKAAPVEKLIKQCPTGSTTCGSDKCCLSPDATCCEDGEHCCPHGYRCDIAGKRCLRNTDNNNYIPATPNGDLFKFVRKYSYKTCPGGSRRCPSHMSCCLQDEGVWDCCTNPSSPFFSKEGDDNCCLSIIPFTFICCTAVFPYCTPFGCI